MGEPSGKLPALDPTRTNAGYGIGRLIAFGEHLQKESIGREVTSSIRKVFLDKMSLCPQAASRDLFLKIEKHMDKFRRKAQKEGKSANCTYIWWSRIYDQIRSILPVELPVQFSFDESHQCMMGLYQQEKWFYAPNEIKLAWEEKYNLRLTKKEEAEAA